MAEFTTGKAARTLRVPQSILRALCQAGLIAARSTDGGHWRIPKGEVDRLRREGVPKLPDPPAEPEPSMTPTTAPAPNSKPHPALLAKPSDKAITAADEAVVLENEVKGLELKRAKEENLDWFRERERQNRAQKAAAEQHSLQTRAKRVRQEWIAHWLGYALATLPKDEWPPAVELDIRENVEKALAGLGPSHPHYLTESVVLAAVDKALFPWRRRKEIEQVLQEARKQLSVSARSWTNEPNEWDLRAMNAAAEAIKQLNADATLAEIRAAALEAAKTVAEQYDRADVLDGVPYFFTGEQAKGAVKAALEKLPVGATRSEMEQARHAALAPFRAAKQVAAQADRYLIHVSDVIEELGGENGDWDLGDFLERHRLAEKLKIEIRPSLIRKLCAEALDYEDAHEFIEETVRRRLDLPAVEEDDEEEEE